MHCEQADARCWASGTEPDAAEPPVLLPSPPQAEAARAIPATAAVRPASLATASLATAGQALAD